AVSRAASLWELRTVAKAPNVLGMTSAILKRACPFTRPVTDVGDRRDKHALQARPLGQGVRRGATLWSTQGQPVLAALPLLPHATDRRDALQALYRQLVSKQGNPFLRFLWPEDGQEPLTFSADRVFAEGHRSGSRRGRGSPRHWRRCPREKAVHPASRRLTFQRRMAMIHFMDKRVFIVRPFGTQEGIDFDAVERTLIQPAIKRVKTAMLAGGTTLPFVEQGNIREDMFRELVTSDLVVADLSIHNANVFYELGIRHGMRPNATLLLRAKSDRKYPFDLQTDRYLTYDAAKPEEAVEALAQALDATLNSGRTDSPVYQLLPNLRAPDPATLRVVPSEFGEAVDLARAAQLRGDLRLLAHEARGFPWATPGLRAVGAPPLLVHTHGGGGAGDCVASGAPSA